VAHGRSNARSAAALDVTEGFGWRRVGKRLDAHPRRRLTGSYPCASPCASCFSPPAVSAAVLQFAMLKTPRRGEREIACQHAEIRLYQQKGRDSNPGDRSRGLTVFKACVDLAVRPVFSGI